MKNHVVKRVENMLQGVKIFENKNQNSVLEKIKDLAIEELEKIQ